VVTAGTGERLREATAPGPVEGRARWLVLFSITTGTFMANVDTTAVTVALPTIGREFGVTLDALQWVLSAYLLTITAILPLFGRLGDMLGRKPILNIGLGLFTAASVACAFAPSFPVLIASRALQGIGASMFMATVMATAVTTFPPELRGRVLGLISSIVAAGTLLGPSLGGLLTDVFGWRAIFLINLPIGLLGAVGTLLFVPTDRGTGGGLRSLDVPGAVLFAVFVAALLLGLGRGPSSGWADAEVIGLLGAAVVLVLLFVLRERRVAQPLIDLQLLRQRVFGLGNLACLLYFMLITLTPFLFPLYLQEVLGWSTGTTGLVMTLQAVAMLLVSPLSGWWSDRAGSGRPALVALAVLLLGMLAAAFLDTAAPTWLVALLLALLGVGPGMFNSPNNSAVMGAVPRERAGTASGILSTTRNLGRAMGVAVVALCYQVFAGTSQTAGVAPETFLAGFRGVFLVGAGIAATTFVVVAFMHRRPASAPSG
jgi:EmrB/QacA subfamily drug resistance transporter